MLLEVLSDSQSREIPVVERNITWCWDNLSNWFCWWKRRSYLSQYTFWRNNCRWTHIPKILSHNSPLVRKCLYFLIQSVITHSQNIVRIIVSIVCTRYIVLGDVFLDTQESEGDETQEHCKGEYFLIDTWFFDEIKQIQEKKKYH